MRRAHSGPLALLSLIGEFGSDPLGAGFGSFADPVDVQVSVLSAIPLPASLLMLLLGLGGLLGCRLTRKPRLVRMTRRVGPSLRKHRSERWRTSDRGSS